MLNNPAEIETNAHSLKGLAEPLRTDFPNANGDLNSFTYIAHCSLRQGLFKNGQNFSSLDDIFSPFADVIKDIANNSLNQCKFTGFKASNRIKSINMFR